MSANFTKGPWLDVPDRCVSSGDGVVCEVWSWMGCDEADANQRLIAAAPELFVLLQRVARCKSIRLDELPDTARQVDALLARVRGAA